MQKWFFYPFRNLYFLRVYWVQDDVHANPAASDVLIHASSQMCKQNSTYLNKAASLLLFLQVQGG